ncbi:hypothetical protein [Humidisolicoccus flavus]|uniref:hypothetical protein n=1 Tax=Humidisolicoccus flavus TaxID=3111414 RepID=UPI00324C1E20
MSDDANSTGPDNTGPGSTGPNNSGPSSVGRDSASSQLALIDEMRNRNFARLVTPRRFWVMVGLLVSILALFPYFSLLPIALQFAVPVGLMLAIAIGASWRQPRARRQTRMTARSYAEVAVLALVVGVLGALSTASSADPTLWWAPAVIAVLVVLVVAAVGPQLEKGWAKRASEQNSRTSTEALLVPSLSDPDRLTLAVLLDPVTEQKASDLLPFTQQHERDFDANLSVMERERFVTLRESVRRSNDDVWIRLTETGRRALDSHVRALNAAMASK